MDKKICLEFLSIKAGGIDFGKGIIKTRPKFSGMLKNKQPVRGRIIDSFVNNYYQDHQEEMQAVLLRTITNWDKINQKFYESPSRGLIGVGLKTLPLIYVINLAKIYKKDNVKL